MLEETCELSNTVQSVYHSINVRNRFYRLCNTDSLSLCIFRRYITTILSLRIFVLYSLFCVYSFFADRISSIEVRRSKQRRIGLSILIMKKTQQKEERKKNEAKRKLKV